MLTNYAMAFGQKFARLEIFLKSLWNIYRAHDTFDCTNYHLFSHNENEFYFFCCEKTAKIVFFHQILLCLNFFYYFFFAKTVKVFPTLFRASCNFFLCFITHLTVCPIVCDCLSTCDYLSTYTSYTIFPS